MSMDLNIIEDSARTGIAPQSAQERAGDDSRFSNLLARQLGHSSSRRQEVESSGSDTVARRQNDDETRSAALDDRAPGNEVREEGIQNRQPGPGAQAEPGTQPEVSETNPIFSSLESWQSLTWPTSAADPVSLLTISNTTMTGNGELAVAIQSRLAGEIAARFSDSNGVQNLTMKLDPAHLGRLEVNLQARGDHLSVQITAASREAETALRENLRDLTDAIQGKTGRFQQVEVKVDLKSGDGPDQHGAEKEQRQPGQRESRGEGSGQGKNPGGHDHPDNVDHEAGPDLRAQEG